MFKRTDDLRIRDVRPLIPPSILLEEIPISERASNLIADTRAAIAAILTGADRRSETCSSKMALRPSF